MNQFNNTYPSQPQAQPQPEMKINASILGKDGFEKIEINNEMSKEDLIDAFNKAESLTIYAKAGMQLEMHKQMAYQMLMQVKSQSQNESSPINPFNDEITFGAPSSKGDVPVNLRREPSNAFTVNDLLSLITDASI